MICPLCPSDWCDRDQEHFENIDREAIDDDLRDACNKVKEHHDNALRLYSEMHFKDHTASGLSFTQILEQPEISPMLADYEVADYRFVRLLNRYSHVIRHTIDHFEEAMTIKGTLPERTDRLDESL